MKTVTQKRLSAFLVFDHRDEVAVVNGLYSEYLAFMTHIVYDIVRI